MRRLTLSRIRPSAGTDIARLQNDDVSRYQFAGRDLLQPSVATRPHRGHGHALQRRHGLFRLEFLQITEEGVQNDDDQDDNGFHPIAQQRGDESRDDQQNGQHAAQLLGEDLPARPAFLADQFVESMPDTSPPHLIGGQSLAPSLFSCRKTSETVTLYHSVRMCSL